MPETAAKLGWNSYGKSRVRMVKVARNGALHELHDLTVDVALEGDFTAAHVAGDNRQVLPTDTMKNTVYALGKSHPLRSIESFSVHLAQHFTLSHPHVTAATVAIASHPWRRAECRGKPHTHSFMQRATEAMTCTARAIAGTTRISSGISDLLIWKTTDSAFCDFLHDQFTTLKDADDRILGTAMTVSWDFAPGEHDWNDCRQRIVRALIDTFCEHKSLSVQHTLYAMAEAAIAASPATERIHLSMPNKHCLLVDLSPFGMKNPNEVFVPIDEPHGLIEATVERA